MEKGKSLFHKSIVIHWFTMQYESTPFFLADTNKNRNIMQARYIRFDWAMKRLQRNKA